MTSYLTSTAGRKCFAMTDGRDRCGSVEQGSGGCLVATDSTGQIVGRFSGLVAAVGALLAAESSSC